MQYLVSLTAHKCTRPIGNRSSDQDNLKIFCRLLAIKFKPECAEKYGMI